MGGGERRLDKGWGKQGGEGKDDAVSVPGRGATATMPCSRTQVPAGHSMRPGSIITWGHGAHIPTPYMCTRVHVSVSGACVHVFNCVTLNMSVLASFPHVSGSLCSHLAPGVRTLSG